MRGRCPLCYFILQCKYINILQNLVGLLGVEPRLFWTKTRRVANYTIGQEGSNLK